MVLREFFVFSLSDKATRRFEVIPAFGKIGRRHASFVRGEHPCRFSLCDAVQVDTEMSSLRARRHHVMEKIVNGCGDRLEEGMAGRHSAHQVSKEHRRRGSDPAPHIELLLRLLKTWVFNKPAPASAHVAPGENRLKSVLLRSRSS